MSSARAILFLDRDGTLIADVGYPKDPATVRLLPGAAEAVKDLASIGCVPIVVSNQSGVARGIISHDEAERVHRKFVELFAEASGIMLPCYYCFHGPEDDCSCRKPKPGLLLQARTELAVHALPGVIVGDKLSDVEAGERAGYWGFLFTGDWPAITARISQWLEDKESSW